MDSFELNKIAGAVLFAVLVGFGLSIFSEILFETEAPEEPGYVIAVAEAPEGGEAAGAAEAQPIAVLLASADPAAGEASGKKCAACHTFGNGEANKVGPNLWNVVNRPIASVAGFAYSEAMLAHSQGQTVPWDYEQLNGFLRDPKGHIAGTKMAFAGLKQDPERASMIAYLRSLSDAPAPLPEPPPAGAPEQAAAPDAAAQPPASNAAQPPPGGAPAGAAAPEAGPVPPAGAPAASGQAGSEQPSAGTLGPGAPMPAIDNVPGNTVPDTAPQQVQPIEEEAPEPGAQPSAGGQPGGAPAPAAPAPPAPAPPAPAPAPAAPAPAPAEPAAPQPAAAPPAPAAPAPPAPAQPAPPVGATPGPTGEPGTQGIAPTTPAVPAAPAEPPPAPAAPAQPSPAPPPPGTQGAVQPAPAQQQVAQAAPSPAAAPAGDPAKGETGARKCIACHTFEKGGANKLGPNLWGVVGRPVASVPGFAYSQAMVAFAEGGAKRWDIPQLDPYLLDPKAHVPGTKMVFVGLKRDPERADVIAYLQTLSDAPAPAQ